MPVNSHIAVKNMPAKAIVSAIILIASLVTAQASEKSDYQLKDLDGKLHSVSNLRGKWLVINFWASWCPPCIKEMPELENFYQNNKEIAEVWGVTFEDSNIAGIKDFVKKLNVNYPILGFGQDPKTGYGLVTVLPTTFIIDRRGQFLHRFEGPITEADIVNMISAK